jgi:hypothetical protein
MFRDLNDDRTPDLYVATIMFSTDKLVERSGPAISRDFAGFAHAKPLVDGCRFADINRDGFDDLVVVDMLSRDHSSRQRQRANFSRRDLRFADVESRPEVMRNTLFLNRGDGTFAEIAQLGGVAASEWSWSAIFLDVDLDGLEDLLVTNGNDHDSLDAEL